jgi:hypothetical protein
VLGTRGLSAPKFGCRRNPAGAEKMVARGKLTGFLLFAAVLNCVAALGMVSNQVPILLRDIRGTESRRVDMGAVNERVAPPEMRSLVKFRQELNAA